MAASVFCAAAFSPSPYDTAFSEGSGITVGVCRLVANHRHLAIFESAPEVRGLCSAGVTRPQRSYAPVRLPPAPSPKRDVEAATSERTGLPRLLGSPFQRAVPPYPGGPNRCACRLLPCPCGLPRISGGSASASSLSRPAQASLTLRPTGSLSRPRRPLSQGSGPLLSRPPVSYSINRLTIEVESSSTGNTRLRGALCESGGSQARPGGMDHRGHRRRTIGVAYDLCRIANSTSASDRVDRSAALC